MEVVSIEKHDTDAVVRATVNKFSESKPQVEGVLRSAGLEYNAGNRRRNTKHGTEERAQDPERHKMKHTGNSLLSITMWDL